MTISIPKFSLVLLIGPSGSGKSTFAAKHFRSTEVLSSDTCRGIICDDENDQRITGEAFELLHYIASKRLAQGRLTVIDATNLQRDARKPLIDLARKYHCLPVAIIFNLPEKICVERNAARPDRDFGARVIRQHSALLRRSLKSLRKEGIRQVAVLNSPEEVEAVTIERVPLWTDKTGEHGPFDIIGDIHGCVDELKELLTELGYRAISTTDDDPVWGNSYYAHSEGRKAVFLGDLVDRGPGTVEVLRVVRNMVVQGTALCVPGNHDVKLIRKLRGRDVALRHGLAETVAQIQALPEEIRERFCKEVAAFLDGLVSHYVLDAGRLVVAHAGMKESMQGRASGAVREFALYGETTGETDEFGLPVRYNWAIDYRGQAMVVYGHTPVPEPDWLNNTINIDTGCVFGGRLTALRYPEKEFVSVDSKKIYCVPAKPFQPESASALTAQQRHDDLLDAEDVLGKRYISTRLRGTITIREENATAALEVMSRFAANPKWLIYLPPTMSPSETSNQSDYLEHPSEGFDYFRNHGIPRVICEEKHMGSRAVVVVCRDEEAARERFGVVGESGIITTRTGRRFFDDQERESQLLDRFRRAMDADDFWETFQTSWACFDCELMPWSAKAQELLRHQYAAVGAAGRAALSSVRDALTQFQARSTSQSTELFPRLQQKRENIHNFVDAYRRYCWPVQSVDDFKLAPFHLLATQGALYWDKDHSWHMQTLANIVRHDPRVLLATQHRIVDVTDEASRDEGIKWWRELTESGGEGMVIKPLSFIARGKRGLIQPAVKCRGREYLRIIYGPDYDEEANLSRLRQRGLGVKRSLALREFALGVEALERFTRGEPLRGVHECVFGILALESEPVDPRL